MNVQDLKPKELNVRLRDWISECENNMEKLNEWEQSFIESISDQLTRRGSLSNRQIEILERCYVKV